MEGKRSTPHVVVLPWLAFGHLLPYLQLSKALARRGLRVSFLSTPRNLQRLPSVPPLLSHLLRFVELPFPSAAVPLLPTGAESTSDIQLADNGQLKIAFDALEPALCAFLDSAAPLPDWIIVDFAAHWVGRVAELRRLPCAYFSVFPPAAQAFYGPAAELKGDVPGTGRLWKKPENFTAPPPWIAGPLYSSSVAYRLHEARDLFNGAVLENASGVSDVYRMGSVLDAVQVIVMRSCTEFDGDWLRLLGEIHGKPVIPAGFLPPPLGHEETGKAATAAIPTSSDGAALFEWLDRQAPRSVLYVAMGSEAVLSGNLLHELALGLELSRLSFLWALRRPAGLPPDVPLLPEGFESRTTGKGILAKGWVPQPEILAHRSVGAFLTHTGWSSLVEGFRHGLPMVMLPVFADQGLTARLTGKRGLGMEVPRREEDGAFTRGGVAETIRRVVVGEAGEEVRTAARRAAALFGDRRLQEKYEIELAKFFADRSHPGGDSGQPATDD